MEKLNRQCGAEMSRLLLFYRLMVRPMLQEPVRAALTVLAVALGVAVVLAIDLAGNSATGSFRSSMETLAGDNDFEITASGGVPEAIVGKLATLPYALRVSPRMQDYAVALKTRQSFPLIGLDLVAESSAYASSISSAANIAQPEEALKYLGDNDSVWVGASLGRKPGEHLQLLINDRVADYVVRGVYHDSNGNEAAIVMDLAAAQRALDRFGRVDLILVKVPQTPGFEEWQQRLRAVLPPGVDVNPQGTGTDENRRMLGAFRWNLRLLSYIALVVGAFLIYNTISVSVVRRRAEIGVVRAIGASRAAVLSAFVGEAAFFGLAGAVIGLPLGRLMAIGQVRSSSISPPCCFVL
jgi:putative ABC transport system permease protein